MRGSAALPQGEGFCVMSFGRFLSITGDVIDFDSSSSRDISSLKKITTNIFMCLMEASQRCIGGPSTHESPQGSADISESPGQLDHEVLTQA